MFNAPQIIVLLVIAVLGHAMAFLWYLALKNWVIASGTLGVVRAGNT